jgi:polyhydroxybutyrate depolymerase
MRGLWLVAVFLAACSAGPPPAGDAASAPPLPSPGCRPGMVPAAVGEHGEVDGRSYLLDAPAGPADRPLPLVLAFHGFRSDPEDLRAGAGFLGAAGDGLVVAYPAGHDGVRLLGTVGLGWDLRAGQTTDRDFVRRLIDHLEATRCLDRRRIYATGMSNGGFLASLLGCQLADRLAAVAPVAGGHALGGCEPARPVPVLFLYGAADTIVPPRIVREGVEWWVGRNGCDAGRADGGCTRWTGCTATVAACQGPQGHRWPADAAVRIRAFFREHALP